MPIDVLFRGPVLFLINENRADHALIPDGTRVLTDDSGARGRHPDGVVTTPHFAGIAVFDGDRASLEVYRADLRRKIVTLIADDGEVTCRATDVTDLVPIDTAANANRAPMTLLSRSAGDYWTRVAARVEYRGGSLRASLPSRATFVIDGVPRLQKPSAIPLSAAWSTETDTARIQITDADGTGFEQITIRNGQVGFIYNWDEREPTAAELVDLPACADGGQLKTDTDFKWMYELFRPPAPSYSAWLGMGVELPAPKTSCMETSGGNAGRAGVPSPGSSGCVSAFARITR